VDVDRISQVITNYLTNALRYAPEDRPITVSLRVESHNPQARKARVAVHDEGPGIPPDEQERIWARFEQSARVPYAQPHQGTGLGLGLYISREIVEQHGGQVGVESVEGEGSTFWFTLPLAPEAVPSVTSTALPPST
jgi:signal transduction histidine kinase